MLLSFERLGLIFLFYFLCLLNFDFYNLSQDLDFEFRYNSRIWFWEIGVVLRSASYSIGAEKQIQKKGQV
ncbi:hypothetical protein N206_07165 [Helicobacter pylori UM111]|nr:hypothetical protein N206_07165 [Helicobacter pylori UM111]